MKEIMYPSLKTMECITCFFYGVSFPVFVWSVVYTVKYQSDFDRYNYYAHQYETNGHDQDDFEKMEKYYQGFANYYYCVLLDILMSMIIITPVIAWVRLWLLERRRRQLETQYFPTASSHLIS